VEQKIAKMPHAKANDQLERMSSFFFMITPIIGLVNNFSKSVILSWEKGKNGV